MQCAEGLRRGTHPCLPRLERVVSIRVAKRKQHQNKANAVHDDDHTATTRHTQEAVRHIRIKFPGKSLAFEDTNFERSQVSPRRRASTIISTTYKHTSRNSLAIPTMESEHRKIELQSPADLTFLTTQLRTAARQKIDLNLPRDTSGPDELRRNVEELVDAFVARILSGIRNNISINGIDVVHQQRGSDEMDGVVVEQAEGASEVEKEEYEVFDEKLRTKLSSTIAKRDNLIAKISQHRRTTPGAAAEAFQKQFERENEMLMGATVEEIKLDVADVEGLQRQEEIQRNWERAVEGLARLNKGLPETRARLERAGEVVRYLGGEGKN